MINLNTIAIIPARKGSKGIPLKNIIPVNGKPLIEYTLEAAIRSSSIDLIVVTTDSIEIIDILKKYNNNRIITINRPADLCNDDSKTEDAIKHAYYELIQFGFKPQNYVLLQPTSPIRTCKQIDESIALFFKSGKESLISVTDPIQHPYDFIIKHNHNYKYSSRPSGKFRRQDFDINYFINGSIYISHFDLLLNKNIIYDLENCEIFLMPIESSVDIDNFFDLKFCEFILNNMKGDI